MSELSFTASSLSLPNDMDFDSWTAVGEKIHGMARNLQWWWGDWLNFGEKRYGEKYTVAIEQFGLKLEAAKNYAWVAGVFEKSTRVDASWSHHRELAGIADETERTELLQEALENKWSVARLRQEIKAAPLLKEPPPNQEPEELGNLVAEIRRTCADWRDRFGTNRLTILADYLLSESQSTRERADDS